MQPDPFHAPSLETMNRLLPALGFKALIHEDSQGAVFLATQRSLDREVAVKILSPAASRQPEFRQLFEQTARAMARLKHPNLISVIDSGLVDEMLYLVMEFVPGKSLERSARGHRVELEQTLSLIDGICEGVAQAHAHGIVHGNLHPAHILLTRQAEPKIGNFGQARPSTSANTPGFPSPPELSSPDARATTAADIHAVGAILYQLITARPHAADAPPPSSVAGIPAWIDDIWRKATHPSPNHRFASIRELRDAIREKRNASPHAKRATHKPAAQPAPHPPVTPATRQAASPLPSSNKPATPMQNPEPSAPPPKVGFNWKLLRNLIIIGGLLYAIHWTWHYRKAVLTENERKNRAAQAEQQAEKQRRLDEARNRPVQSQPNERPDVTPAPRTESPAQSLKRLRSALAAGERDELPVTSIRRGTCDYLLVNNPLTWLEASWFAEQHGAHLAIPSAEADLSWLATQVAKGSPFWLGAGRSGRTSWTLANGTPWNPKKTPPGTGPYLSADAQGSLLAADSKQRLPFILQWHRDGSNPAALTTVLAATAQSIKAGKPVFPPGIRVLGNRFFLTVLRDVDWQQAADLAASAGGHLAVASDSTEVIQLKELAAGLAPDENLWLGASRPQSAWKWVTGETWKSENWSPTARKDAPGQALYLLPDGSWNAAQPTEPLSGFIIEWSRDRMTPAAR